MIPKSFEIVFGRAVVQATWAPRIASDYDLAHGGLLALGLLVLAPLIMMKVR